LIRKNATFQEKDIPDAVLRESNLNDLLKSKILFNILDNANSPMSENPKSLEINEKSNQLKKSLKYELNREGKKSQMNFSQISYSTVNSRREFITKNQKKNEPSISPQVNYNKSPQNLLNQNVTSLTSSIDKEKYLSPSNIINKREKITSRYIKNLSNSNSVICISGKSLEYILFNSCYYNNKIGNINKNSINNKQSKQMNIFDELLDLIKCKAVVFYRMTPENKTSLIKILKTEADNVVMMVGDGVNDAGAINEADVGVTINVKHGNIAPFRSFYCKENSIKCVEFLIKESIAASENRYISINYLIISSVNSIITEYLLFTVNAELLNLQKYYIDLFLIIIGSAISSKTKPDKKFSNRNRPDNKIKIRNFLKYVLGEILIQIAFKLCFYFYLKSVLIDVENDIKIGRRIRIFNSVRIF